MNPLIKRYIECVRQNEENKRKNNNTRENCEIILNISKKKPIVKNITTFSGP